ncbi:MAG: hypothetical protein U1F25_13625 [Rubrivivax sp.]
MPMSSPASSVPVLTGVTPVMTTVRAGGRRAGQRHRAARSAKRHRLAEVAEAHPVAGAGDPGQNARARPRR